ncbi:hypothetical protein BH09BAC4_BH09BAC4_10580 [soil metagenome]
MKKDNETKPWETSTDRYVGFLDIMGFKDMITRRTHDEVYELMQNVSKSVSSIQSVFAVDYESEADIDLNITMILFSDSIMVFTRDDEEHSLENLIASISALSDSLFADGVPHKGAIAFGKMTLDFNKSIFFGQPLVDAFLLQDELKFYGIVVHGTAERNGDIFEDESVIEYNCPFKNGIAKHLTIAPGISLTDEFEEKTVDKLIEKVAKFRVTTSGSLRKYIDNTLDYLQFVKAEGQRILKEEDDLEAEDDADLGSD